MTPAMFLNKKETKKISDKSSIAYNTLMVMLKELKDRTGFKFSVIGTNDNGDLYEFDVDG